MAVAAPVVPWLVGLDRLMPLLGCEDAKSLAKKLLPVIVAGTATTLGIYVFLQYEHHRRFPRGFTSVKFVKRDASEGVKSNTVPPCRTQYSVKKIPEDIDVIVIGSGIGGLACAGLLSRVGQRCLVLEQHYIAGGCTHAFEEHGYEFDTGLHYVGNIEKRQKYFNLLTNDGDRIEWDRMGGRCSQTGEALSESDPKWGIYDEIRIGDDPVQGHFDFRAGKQHFVDDLVSRFGEKDRPAIEKYVQLCVDVSKKDLFFDTKIAKPAWLARLLNRVFSDKFFRMNQRTALEVISQDLGTDNRALQTALLAQFGDYGDTPSKCSFFLHASVANHYFEGGWYPRGGTCQIANKIIPVIQQTGGNCLVRRAVRRIILEDVKTGTEVSHDLLADGAVSETASLGFDQRKYRAIGVEMDDKDSTRIYARTVVSACGVFNTFTGTKVENTTNLILNGEKQGGTGGGTHASLLPPQVVPQSLKERIGKIGQSSPMVYLFVGMEGTPTELNLRSANIWHWPVEYDKSARTAKNAGPGGNGLVGGPEPEDYDEMLTRFYADPVNAPIPLFIGFPCAKDSSWPQRFPGKSNAIVLTMIDYEHFQKFEGVGKQGKRGSSYESAKQLFETRMLEGLYHYYPQCRGRVDMTLVGSPLTFNHFLGTTQGEVYGMSGSPERFDIHDWMRPQTQVENLFLTGVDVTTLGVTGALMAGILTAHAVAGYGSVVDMVSGRNMVEDLWHLEASQKR